MVLTDSHAHLSYIAEKEGLPALSPILDSYAEAWEEAVGGGRTGPILLDAGVEPGDLPGRLALVGGAPPPFLRFGAGAWPSAENLASPAASLAALDAAIAAAALRGARVAAVGEGGLDYHHMEGSKEAQAELFEGLLALAGRRGLPLIVHSRDAAADTIALIASARAAAPGASAAVIIHCFGYGPEEARSFLDLGCHLSFAGNLTYRGSGALRDACALVPDERLLLETDAPFMNPMPRRGRPSSPLDIDRTYALAAGLRGVGVAELGETVSCNARALFG